MRHPEEVSLQRRFSVHGAADSPARGLILDGLTFEDAALHFIENWGAAGDGDEEVALFVEDCETGERQCFRIDLSTGETSPCD